MYQIGEFVVHPMHGAGRVDAIVQERFGAAEQSYYVLRLLTVGELVLKIPVNNAQNVGMRKVMTAQEGQRLLQSFQEPFVEPNTTWSKRYRDNMERLKSGNMDAVVMVLKSLLLRERARGLSTGERKLLRSAKQIFITEVALVLEMEQIAVERAICKALQEASQAG